MQIAKILKADKILTAKAYYAKQKGKLLPDNPYNWNENSIVGILERMDYCGHTVNFKSYSKIPQAEKSGFQPQRNNRQFSAIPMKQSLRKPSLNGYRN